MGETHLRGDRYDRLGILLLRGEVGGRCANRGGTFAIGGSRVGGRLHGAGWLVTVTETPEIAPNGIPGRKARGVNVGVVHIHIGDNELGRGENFYG